MIKRMINKIKSNWFILPVGVGLLYNSFQSIINFYRGYHNLDLSFNFLNLGYTTDINAISNIVGLKEYYLIGLNQMKSSLGFLAFSIILAFILGYLINKGSGGLK